MASCYSPPKALAREGRVLSAGGGGLERGGRLRFALAQGGWLAVLQMEFATSNNCCYMPSLRGARRPKGLRQFQTLGEQD